MLQQLWTNSLVLFLVAGSCISLFSIEIVRVFLGAQYLASAAIVPPIVLASRLLKKSVAWDRQIDPDVLPCSQYC